MTSGTVNDKLIAITMCEITARNTGSMIREVSLSFGADLDPRGEAAFKKALLLSIELERALNEARSWENG